MGNTPMWCVRNRVNGTGTETESEIIDLDSNGWEASVNFRSQVLNMRLLKTSITRSFGATRASALIYLTSVFALFIVCIQQMFEYEPPSVISFTEWKFGSVFIRFMLGQ